MKKYIMVTAVIILFFFGSSVPLSAQGMMEGYCPMCGRNWDGGYTLHEDFPLDLPAPKNELWVDRLGEVLALEKLSKQQYEADSAKYRAAMPYMMVIPQEDDHILWIEKLFDAYGLLPEEKTYPVEKTASFRQALIKSANMESSLIRRYEWLIKNAEDDESKNVLETILLQTRMHYAMFTHSLRVGPAMGWGWR